MTNITVGSSPLDAGQTVSIVVTTNSNIALFSSPPQFTVITGTTATLADLYTLAPNQNGTAMLAIVAQDDGGTQFGGQDTSPTQFLTISTTLQPPVAFKNQVTFTEDVVGTGGLIATDPQDLPLTISIVSNGTLGTAVIADPTVGSFTYTPNLHVSGTDQITFKVNNGYLDSNIATVTIFVVAVNYPPTVVSVGAAPNPAAITETVSFFAAAEQDIEDGTNLKYADFLAAAAGASGSSVSHAYATCRNVHGDGHDHR